MADKPGALRKWKVVSGTRLRKILQDLPPEDGKGPLAGFRGKDLGKSLFVAAAYDGSPCHLLYRLQQREVILEPLPDTTGIVIKEVGERERFLVVQSGVDADPQAFVELMEVIIDAYLSKKDQGANFFLKTVWKYIVRPTQRPPISHEIQTGLMGELSVLEHDLLPLMSARQAVNCWQGPFHAAKDFKVSTCFIEVKATTSREERTFCVSSEEQFLEPEDRPMFLCFVTFEKDAAGESLAQAFARVGDLLKPDSDAFDRFDDAVSKAGFKKQHRSKYKLETFRLIGREYFRVDATFPRLRLAELKRLLRCYYVSKIQYSIDVDHLTKIAREIVMEEIESGDERPV